MEGQVQCIGERPLDSTTVLSSDMPLLFTFILLPSLLLPPSSHASSSSFSPVTSPLLPLLHISDDGDQ